MANKSKYNFDEVEMRLDIIKNDQGANKVLLGNGTYAEISNVITTEEIKKAASDIVDEKMNQATDADIDALF